MRMTSTLFLLFFYCPQAVEKCKRDLEKKKKCDYYFVVRISYVFNSIKVIFGLVSFTSFSIAIRSLLHFRFWPIASKLPFCRKLN